MNQPKQQLQFGSERLKGGSDLLLCTEVRDGIVARASQFVREEAMMNTQPVVEMPAPQYQQTPVVERPIENRFAEQKLQATEEVLITQPQQVPVTSAEPTAVTGQEQMIAAALREAYAIHDAPQSTDQEINA